MCFVESVACRSSRALHDLGIWPREGAQPDDHGRRTKGPSKFQGMVDCFSRMRSEGFPFIVGGLGVGAVFAWLASSRRLSSRLKFAAIGGSFCK